MSFQNKSFWMPRDAGCLAEGDLNYDTSSRMEPKRAHHWFMDASEPELFCNKKQAVEAVNSRAMPGISNAHAHVSLWENNASFQSSPGQFPDRLFGSETARAFNLVDRSIPAVGTGNLNTERKDFEDQFGSNSSIGSSTSPIEDPSSCVNYGGIRKVKVNQVRDPENGMSVPTGPSYSRGENNTISVGNAYNKTDNISLGPTYNSGNENTISMGPSFNKADDNFILMGHTFDKGDGNFMLMGHNYNKGDANILSMGQPFDRGNESFISVGQRYEKGNGSIISAGAAYDKGQENFISMGSAYNRAHENFISIGPSYDKGDDNVISMGQPSDKADTSIVPMGTTYDKGNSSILPMGQNYNKGESNTISFGVFPEEPETNPSGGIISGYGLLTSQPPGQTSKAPGQDEHNIAPIVNIAPAATAKTDATAKNKEQKQPKKAPPNNFPSNVKSLLSTGMLDGVPVKYVSWSREKNLKAIIKGMGYLCGCLDCNYDKALNAYEFERHTGCKTKHPNNHIYFENGKTIYAVVQELKSTPQEMLFEAIQNVTGSPINQKNFRIWKASYQAATRELQRIYGKDEVVVPS